MKTKIIDKLFTLAYTDSMTETHNRNAYEEQLKKLRRDNANLKNITVVVIDITKSRLLIIILILKQPAFFGGF